MTGPGWSRQDRAVAELARARGWVPDDALDRLLAGGAQAGGIGEALVREGLLTRAQLASLAEAVSGSGSRAGVAPSGTDATMVAGQPVPDAAPAAAPASIGPYRILRELGRGGMGVVYRALDTQLRREVALKLLLAGADASDQAVERFRREAALLARVGAHPHLVHVHDVGRDEGRLYFTMDYIEGTSVRERLDREGALAPREAARIAAEVASALAAAHRAGVVHRDVKPHNILLGPGGAAFLTDFGLAREEGGGGGLTLTGDVLGTPAYMSPEQAAGQGKTAGPATDIWSLGATLFEMLTGRTPFTGTTPAEILRRAVEEDAPSPGSVSRGIHQDLQTICTAALRREPARRYPSAAELEADLRRFLAGEPVHARPVSGLERLMGRLRRRKGVAAAAVVALTLAVAAVARARHRTLDAQAGARAADARTAEGERLLKRGREFLAAFEAALAAGDDQGFATALPSAVRDLRSAVELMPESDAAAAWLGKALRNWGLLEEAEKELRRATVLNPRQALAWEELGGIAVSRLRKIRGDMKHHVYRVSGFTGIPMATMDFDVDLAGGTDADTSALREQATDCYARIAALDVAPARAAYGRGMIAFMAGHTTQAIGEFDRALADDPLMADALQARAEAKDLDRTNSRGGVDDWKRLVEIRPLDYRAIEKCALSMLRAGESEGVPDLIQRVESRFSSDPDVLAITGVLWYGIGRLDDATRFALRAAALYRDTDKVERSVIIAVQSNLAKRDFAAVRELSARFAPRLRPLVTDFIEFLALFEEGRWCEARQALRALLRMGGGVLVDNDYIATIEWRCGNLDIAGAVPFAADGVEPSAMGLWTRGIVRMDEDRLPEAIRDFEEVKRQRPEFVPNYVHLAGARFLSGDDAGAADAMEQAIAQVRIPEETRKTVQNVLANFRSRLAAAKTPAERGKVIEGLAGSIAFLAATMPENSPTRRSARVATNALYYLLQEFDFRAGLYAESIAAGALLIKAEPWGCNLYKDARSRAAAGKRKSALASLRRAVEEGFDDGRRLDAEKAFDPLRDDPEYRELRALCR